MTLTIAVQLNGASATYEVKHEIDHIYKATRLGKDLSVSYQFPEKIVLIKSGDSWSSDCSHKEIGLFIGQKINEQNDPAEFVAVKTEVNLPDMRQQNTPEVSCRILIIDDDEDDVAILSDAFTQCGIDDVHYVFSGMQAFIYLEKLEPSSLPKLIITDHYLPGMTGAEFLKDLKGMDKYRHIPLVVLSTTKSEREIEKYREMGALEYLIKPTDYNDYVRVAADMKSRAEL